MSKYYISRVYSEDDGGYYVEVYNRKGETVYVTEIGDSGTATDEALEWIENN